MLQNHNFNAIIGAGHSDVEAIVVALTKPTCSEVKMAKSKICEIPGCGKTFYARGWCENHYYRWRKHGNPLSGGTSPGAPEKFIRDIAMPYTGDDCLKWPYGKVKGYGIIKDAGNGTLVHRVVCEETYGPPPTRNHEAAHSCGKGHLGCVNPRHLRWATPKENCSDKLLHGTDARGEKSGMAKLTKSDVIEIRILLSQGAKQTDVAKKFNVYHNTINAIFAGRSWAWLK